MKVKREETIKLLNPTSGFKAGQLDMICFGTGGKSTFHKDVQLQIIEDAIYCIVNPSEVTVAQKKLTVDYLKKLSKILAIYSLI